MLPTIPGIDLIVPTEAIGQVVFEVTPIRWFEHAGQKWIMRTDFMEASGFRRGGFAYYPGEPAELNANTLLIKMSKPTPMAAVNRAWIEAFVKSRKRHRRKQKKVYDFLRRELWGEEISEQGTLFAPRLTDADAKEFAERVWHHFEKMLNTYGG